MGNIIILIGAGLLLILLLYFENGENRSGIVPTKTLLSCLFIVTAWIQPHPLPRYYHFLLPGLIFCLGGDVLLALPQKRAFLLGLVSFLLGHVFYVVAFCRVGQMNAWGWAGTLVIMAISGIVYVWLRPHLGTMNGPVLFYIVVITAMVSGALAVLGNGGLRGSGRITVLLGALCFYFSDVFVARDRFLRKAFLNRLVGLPMYYTGQFLLAFSVGLII